MQNIALLPAIVRLLNKKFNNFKNLINFKLS